MATYGHEGGGWMNDDQRRATTSTAKAAETKCQRCGFEHYEKYNYDACAIANLNRALTRVTAERDEMRELLEHFRDGPEATRVNALLARLDKETL